VTASTFAIGSPLLLRGCIRSPAVARGWS